MSDKVWGVIPTPAVFAKEANLLIVYGGQRLRFFSLEEVMCQEDTLTHYQPFNPKLRRLLEDEQDPTRQYD